MGKVRSCLFSQLTLLTINSFTFQDTPRQSNYTFVDLSKYYYYESLSVSSREKSCFLIISNKYRGLTSERRQLLVWYVRQIKSMEVFIT